MKRILFLDRDGTILVEPRGSEQVDSLCKFEFLPGVIGALRRIVGGSDYRLVMVSNQDGLGTESFPLADFEPFQGLMLRTLAGEGVVFDDVLIDESRPDQNSPRRKPRTGMVEKYMNELLDRENSFVVGDRDTDMQLAANMGLRGIFVGEGNENPATLLQTTDWGEIADWLIQRPRRARVVRKTFETDITVEINLDGVGRGRISTGIGFFDHMLDQIARHSTIDLDISAVGDLRVDQHHTIEDTAIALGEALRTALGTKRGINRYAFALPMDESRAEVLIDLGGRSSLVWETAFAREWAGDFPTDMTRHFFDSLSRAANITIHVRASGENTHHTIEAIFKATGRALRRAIRREGNDIPSTKGII